MAPDGQDAHSTTVPNDPHVLGPGLLPTPYTAEEIRRGSPSGRTVRTRVLPDPATGETAYVRVSRFADCTPEGAILERWRETLDGNVVGEIVSRPAAWRDLQRHAAFPADATTLDTETITTPLGELECRRYIVRDGSESSTFWFDLDRPGMPVQSVDEVEGRIVETATMVSDDSTDR